MNGGPTTAPRYGSVSSLPKRNTTRIACCRRIQQCFDKTRKHSGPLERRASPVKHRRSPRDVGRSRYHLCVQMPHLAASVTCGGGARRECNNKFQSSRPEPRAGFRKKTLDVCNGDIVN